jgi:hypothetical protein
MHCRAADWERAGRFLGLRATAVDSGDVVARRGGLLDRVPADAAA